MLREFLVNQAGYYVLPIKYMNQKYVQQILSGEKKLIKQEEVKYVETVPKWKELSAKVL